MLRRAILAYALLYLAIAAVLLLVVHAALAIGLYLGLNGAVIVAAFLFERRRYRPTLDRARGYWQLTGERFVDPSSGRAMEVRYNPVTGQRDYVPSDDDSRESW